MSDSQRKTYLRFRVWERIEHLVLIISFTTLALTGLPQKYALNPISISVIQFLGGIETIRIIHHIAAALFLLEAVYHLVMAGYKIYVQRREASMLPGVRDAKDAVQWLGYNLGRVAKPPKMPRYNFMEKMEYWAMLWGLVLMGLTGLMLWNPIMTTNLLPGTFIPAAKAAHGGEAVLAVLAIILWHFYNVHIKHWNWGMIKGTLSRHEMETEHGEELERIESGKIAPLPPPTEIRRRTVLFAPVAALVTIALVGVTYYFLTFEQTSITTLPPAERVAVFVQPTPTLAPPTPTPAPTQPAPVGGETVPAGAVAWTGGIDAMLKERCASCHGTLGGFTATTYADVMKAVAPGNPDGSKIVEVQKGDHPGKLTPDQLALLSQWIAAGAPEQAGGAAAGTGATPAISQTWDGGIKTVFVIRCSTCHGASGGYSVTSYDDVMKKIQPGSPDASKVVEVQKADNHPGMFNADELAQIIAWIQAGAPQQ